MGNQDFACTICGKKYVARGNLWRHQRIVHAKLRYECQICGQTFTTKSKWNLHIKKQHGYEIKNTECHVITKTIEEEEEREKDDEEDEDERKKGRDNQDCSICGKRYVDKVNLWKHKQRAHKGLSYACRTCEKTFSSKSKWNLHVRRDHKNKMENFDDIKKTPDVVEETEFVDTSPDSDDDNSKPLATFTNEEISKLVDDAVESYKLQSFSLRELDLFLQDFIST